VVVTRYEEEPKESSGCCCVTRQEQFTLSKKKKHSDRITQNLAEPFISIHNSLIPFISTMLSQPPLPQQLHRQPPPFRRYDSTHALLMMMMILATMAWTAMPPVQAFQSLRLFYTLPRAATHPRIASRRQADPAPYLPDPLNNRHSASDWLYNVRSLPESKVLREIRNPVLAVFLWSLAVSGLHALGARSSRPLWRNLARHMCIPGTAHSFLVSALGLLLVFRTNSAYQRFNEGRKIWEHILSVSRNMSRMIQLYQTEIGAERQRRIMNLVAAYPYLLRQHIRPGCLCSNRAPDIPPEYRLLLKEQRRMPQETRQEGPKRSHNSRRPRHSASEDDDHEEDLLTVSDASSRDPDLTVAPPVEPTHTDSDCWVDQRALPWSLFMPESLPAIAWAENRPLWVCDRMAALLCKIPYGPNFTSRERLVLLGMVDKLTNAIGQCERIHQTAVPLNYARHSLRSLTLWLFTLPFALVQDLGLLTALANAVIAWLFFGVYQIGYSIEDPFQGSLRLSILCDAIRRSVIRQPSGTDPDEDSAYQLSPEECQNIYAAAAHNGGDNPNIPEECQVPNARRPRDTTDPMRRLQRKEEDFQGLRQMVLQHRQRQADALAVVASVNASVASDAKTIWRLDEEMLATPKIKFRNGTWTEVGI
jgi:predicted membrane chloride channel (bestrophin family)